MLSHEGRETQHLSHMIRIPLLLRLVMLLLLDNYDSFTYNLYQYLLQVSGSEVVVYRNDAISVEDACRFDRIVLSPGPGLPSEAGILVPLIRAAAGKIPLLGVCLGHQAIAEAYGGKLRQLDRVLHGVVRSVKCSDSMEPLFKGIESPFDTGRYHSWVPDEQTFPADLKVIAHDENGAIMALRHQQHSVYGVQFHPESIMTPCGIQLLRNWAEITAS
jgi:anthranilate synthase/aminodeoxychorismate synthase-like glutamine amidotransferase